MKHYGDITKISGAEVEPVDVICGGSPCQDLSVAGKRAGLAGERSGLFMEQIRIIKEMREHDRLHCGRTNESVRPRYMVWENVYGAFNSNKGEDFRAVLEETAKVAQGDAVIPRLAEGQKWSSSGYILGDGWSIAWRGHDAQYWGVPQRRKRICMVADFNGDTAPDILFNPRYGGEAEYSESFQTVGSLGSEPRSEVQPFAEGMQGDSDESREEREDSTAATEGSPGRTICFGGGQVHDAMNPSVELCNTLNCMKDTMKIITLGLDRASFNQGKNALYDFAVEEEIAQPVVARGPGGVLPGYSKGDK